MYSVMVMPYASAWSNTVCLNSADTFIVREDLPPFGTTGGRPTLRFIIFCLAFHHRKGERCCFPCFYMSFVRFDYEIPVAVCVHGVGGSPEFVHGVLHAFVFGYFFREF